VRRACFASYFDIDLCIFAVLYMFGLVDCAITISGPDLWTRGGEGAIPVIDNKVLYHACTVFFIAFVAPPVSRTCYAKMSEVARSSDILARETGGETEGRAIFYSGHRAFIRPVMDI
jgi:hypothetical protein